MPKKTNKDTTRNVPNTNGEKIIQIALDKEQRLCLLDTIVCSKRKYECLLPVIDELEKCVRKEDPENYDRICLKFFVISKCS